MPAERIAAEASEWAADMIVVGSRGRGTVTTMLFGSVSEELIDRAPVPVLVARRPAMRSILVAVDPSPAAHSAIGFVAAHRVFRGLDATVVGVAPEAFAWWFGLADGDPASIEAAYDARDSVEHDEEASAAEAQAALRSAGLRVSTRIVRGNPGDELGRLATELAVDTIVIGTRGRTGLSRLLLGSVTRGVLHHTGCSVLVVHGEPPTQPVPPTTKHEQSADREPARSRSEP
jgi:nucleotide-binding universal stress UspA family protein